MEPQQEDPELPLSNKTIPSSTDHQPLPPDRPYLWTSAWAEGKDAELRFPGFEPCYVACIKDLEWRIKQKIEKIDLKTGTGENPGLAPEMAPLLLQYSEMISALESIESRERVFEEDGIFENDRDKMQRFSGRKRRIQLAARDSDRVHDRLQSNVVLAILTYVYSWDVANKLKRRFGNLTRTFDRLIVGFLGGASLLVPMIMMTFLMGRTARLVIVSVATLLFAAAMSLTSTSKEAVVGATAAYAAVMVVYIGSSFQDS